MTSPRRTLRVLRDNAATAESTSVPDESAASAVPADAQQPDADVSYALRDLLQRFDAFIRRTASRHGLAGQDVDDVVQDLRVRVWKSFGTAELIRRAKPTYLYRVAVSASLDIIRRRRTAKASATSIDLVPPSALADEKARADATLVGSELGRAVHEALDLLSESRRGVVRMYLAGYDRYEIADLLGWSEPKTRNLLYRGLEDLRQILSSRGITRETWQ